MNKVEYFADLAKSIEKDERRMNDDTISRQAAIYAVDEMSYAFNVKTNAHMAFIKALADLPSAERWGRWEDVEHAPNGLLYATCSVCGKRQTIESVNYCGECGARMDGEEK